MKDTITICDLAVSFRVGVPDEERAQPQRLLLTLEIEHDFAAAAAKDDISQTIDYSAVASRLCRLGEGQSWRLLEKLAVDIAELVLAEFSASRVSVEVKKFVLPDARFVSVRLTRPRER